MKRFHHHTLGLYAHILGHQSNSSRVMVTHGAVLHRALVYPKPRSFYLCSNFSSGFPLASSKAVPDTESTPSVNIPVEEERLQNSEPTRTRSSSLNENQMISKITSVDKLLELSTQRTFKLWELCQLVSALGQCAQRSAAGSEKEKIIEDERFAHLCTVLRNANFADNPSFLLQALKGCLNMEMPADHELMQFLENELKWMVRRCPIKYVSKSISLLSSSGQGRMSKSHTKLRSDHPLLIAVDTLQRRWVEVTSGSDFIATFQIISAVNSSTGSKIEDRATELVQEFTPMEIIKIFIALGDQKRRPTPLLRALAFHLSKSSEKIPVKDWIELIFALHELSFAEPVLMSKICNEISPEIMSISNPALISSLVTSLGHLRYKHKDLILALDEWIVNHDEVLRPIDRAAWLLTSSTLNIRTENTAEFCTKAKQTLTVETTKSPMSWVNIVHSLLVLDQADAALLSSVLAPSFVSTLDSLGSKAAGAKLKILNVNAAAKILKGYSGPSLSTEVVSKWVDEVVRSSDAKLSAAVVETLGNFLPPPKYLRPGRSLDGGFYIDAECKLNAKLDPVPFDLQDKTKLISVAFLSYGYSSCTIGIKEPTGPSLLNVRLLESQGFNVVSVPYMEFNPQEKIIRRVQYLEQKLRNINLQRPESDQSQGGK